MKILILTKARYDYAGQSGYGNPIGLNNSASFITEALTELNYQAVNVAVVDANSVDAEVAKHRPKVVLLEALWVTPNKLRELQRLHPRVQWVVRVHSNIPFLGMESQAFSWMKSLATIPNVQVAANNEQTAKELSSLFKVKIAYLPNIYLLPEYCPGKGRKRSTKFLDVSCFGAIRPFKNQLIQAVAAIDAATHLGRILRFHINGSRVEQKGDSVMQNLVALFDGTPHQLVCHGWQNHADFLLTVAKMDVGLQVSFTESFNIVAADHVHVGVPLVVSSEISWLSKYIYASCTSVDDISRHLINQVNVSQLNADANRLALDRYNTAGQETWKKFLRHI